MAVSSEPAANTDFDGAVLESLEVADRWWQHARRPGYRFYNHRRDVAAVMQSAELLEVIGQLDTVLRLSASEGIALYVQRMAHVIYAGQQVGAEDFSCRTIEVSGRTAGTAECHKCQTAEACNYHILHVSLLL